MLDKRTGKARKQFTVSALPDFYEERPYQEEVIAQALEQERGIIRIATGGGKTYIAARIIHALQNTTLFLVPNKDLLYQAVNTFTEIFGKEHVGIIGDSIWSPSDITVATAQTLWSRRQTKEFATFILSIYTMMIDECHSINKGTKNMPANTWYQIAMAAENAHYRFGLSATPGEQGTTQYAILTATTGQEISDVTARYLIDKGYLSTVEVHLYPVTPKIAHIKGNWQHKYRENIIHNPKRNRLIAYLAEQYAHAGKKILISTFWREEHIDEITQHLTLPYEIVHGSISGTDRSTLYEQFKEGKFNILIGTVVKEGLDIPSASVMIIAGALKKHKTVIQQAGRVLRQHESKNGAIIIDFLDKDHSTLQQWSQERFDAYSAAEYPITKHTENPIESELHTKFQKHITLAGVSDEDIYN